MRRLWVLGSFNYDLIVGCPRFPVPGETLLGESYRQLPGGKGGNQAMALARLDAKPRIVGAVGDDPWGALYRNHLAAAGVKTTGLQTVEAAQTGLALIEVAGGENRIVVVPGANGTLTAASVQGPLADLGAGDLLLLQLEIPLEAVFAAIRLAKARGATVILDPAPAGPLPPDILALVDFLTPNETEAQVLAGPGTGSAAQRLVDRGCPCVVQKAGGRGASLVRPEGEVFVPAFPVRVVDSVGAGDSFNAGFAFALAEGHSPEEAVLWGNATGALSTRATGAQGALATREELESLVITRLVR